MSGPTMLTNLALKDYLRQWVATATEGKVEIEFAWSVSRIHLYCTSCSQMLTAPLPDSEYTIDYSVQEFVKLHSHRQPQVPSWGSIPSGGSTWSTNVTSNTSPIKVPVGAPIPLTFPLKEWVTGELEKQKKQQEKLEAYQKLVYEKYGEKLDAYQKFHEKKKTPIKKDVRGRKFR